MGYTSGTSEIQRIKQPHPRTHLWNALDSLRAPSHPFAPHLAMGAGGAWCVQELPGMSRDQVRVPMNSAAVHAGKRERKQDGVASFSLRKCVCSLALGNSINDLLPHFNKCPSCLVLEKGQSSCFASFQEVRVRSSMSASQNTTICPRQTPLFCGSLCWPPLGSPGPPAHGR